MNGDDLISSQIGSDKERVFFSIAPMEGEVERRDSRLKNIRFCPNCRAELGWSFVRYHHIGRAHCPVCGFTNQKSNYTATKVDYDRKEILVDDDGTQVVLPLILRTTETIYNQMAAYSALREAGLSAHAISSAHEDGRIEHIGQYLSTTPGYFPNYDFIRHLKKELNQDQGSIFRYAAHENTYLNLIYKQLREDPNDIPDRGELCEFIKGTTQSGKNNQEQWTGQRNMIDMLELVKRYYYDPAMKGSNSIKQVLPAILNSSNYLKNKYQQPIYGAKEGIPSLNYSDWRWIHFEDGRVADPYKLLPKMFKDIADKDMELLSEDDELRDGGAAMTAYARMQFEEMSQFERSEIQDALLKYCELYVTSYIIVD